MNLLPIPALDGGRLLFFVIEGIRRKKINPRKEGIIHFIGFALLLTLMIFVTWKDIVRYFIKG
jgi:regulator of sigma E protease